MNTVELDDVGRVLEIYVEAMLARPAEVRPLADLRAGDRSRAGHLDLEGAAAAGRPTTDGAAFYLPERVARFPDGYGNFMVYRMAVLHQLGGVLFGTYRRGPERFADFFGGFEAPGLARALFARLEGARIDAALARAFRGVRRDLLRLIDDALESAPAPPSRPRLRRRSREAALFGLSLALLGAQRALLAAGTNPPGPGGARRASRGRSGAPSARTERASSALRTAPNGRSGALGRNAHSPPPPGGGSAGPSAATGPDGQSDLPAEAAALLRPGASVDDTRRAVRSLYPAFAALRSGGLLAEAGGQADRAGDEDRGPALDEDPAAQSLEMPAPAHHGDPAPERVELRREWQDLASEVELRDDVDPGPIAAGLMEQLQVDELGVLSLQDGDLSGTAGTAAHRPRRHRGDRGRGRRRGGRAAGNRPRGDSPRAWRNCRSASNASSPSRGSTVTASRSTTTTSGTTNSRATGAAGAIFARRRSSRRRLTAPLSPRRRMPTAASWTRRGAATPTCCGASAASSSCSSRRSSGACGA